jgi:hypothetical protein
LEAIKSQKTINQIAQVEGLLPVHASLKVVGHKEVSNVLESHPREHRAHVPIHNCYKVGVAFCYWDVRIETKRKSLAVRQPAERT